MAVPQQQALARPARSDVSLADVLERVLDKGIVIAGDIKLFIGKVELLTLQIRLVVCSIDKAKAMGMDWWTGHPAFSPYKENQGGATEELPQKPEELLRKADAPPRPPPKAEEPPPRPPPKAEEPPPEAEEPPPEAEEPPPEAEVPPRKAEVPRPAAPPPKVVAPRPAAPPPKVAAPRPAAPPPKAAAPPRKVLPPKAVVPPRKAEALPRNAEAPRKPEAPRRPEAPPGK